MVWQETLFSWQVTTRLETPPLQVAEVEVSSTANPCPDVEQQHQESTFCFTTCSQARTPIRSAIFSISCNLYPHPSHTKDHASIHPVNLLLPCPTRLPVSGKGRTRKPPNAHRIPWLATRGAPQTPWPLGGRSLRSGTRDIVSSDLSASSGIASA